MEHSFKKAHYSIVHSFISLIFVFIISGFVFFSWKISNINKDVAVKNLKNNALEAALKLSSSLHLVEERLKYVSQSYFSENKRRSSAKIISMLGQQFNNQLFVNKFFLMVGWLDKKLNLGLIDNEMAFNVKECFSIEKLKVLENKVYGINFGNVNRNVKALKGPVLPITFSIYKENDYVGSIVGIINENIIKNNINLPLVKEKVSVFLVNHNLKEIIFNLNNSKIYDYETLYREISKFREGNKTPNKFVDKSKVFIPVKIEGFPLELVYKVEFLSPGFLDYFNNILVYKYEVLFFLLLVTFLLYFFYQSILNPFLSLSNAASSISKGEEPNLKKLNMNSKEGLIVADTLEKIKKYFVTEKKLVQELSRVHNKLSISNLRLENKVFQRTQDLEKEIKIKNNYIEQFAAEISNPLEALLSFMKNILYSWENLKDVAKYNFIQKTYYSLNRVSALINDFSETTKLSYLKEELHISKFDLTEVVEEIIFECKNLYVGDKSIKISFKKEGPFFINADKHKITIVLRNLFLNSIINSSQNSYISVRIITSINQDLKSVHFILQDQSKANQYDEDISLLSIHNNIERENKAFKIRLNVCYEIINAHFGKIWAENNKDGGMTFNFIIPVDQPVKDNILTNIKENFEKSNILMIDDEEMCMDTMELILKSKNYNLIKCTSGKAGLDYLKEHHEQISLVLLDLMIPDFYGLNILSEMKNNQELKNIPVILQTGSSDEEEIIKAFNMGITCFIRKPYSKEMVINEVEKALCLSSFNDV